MSYQAYACMINDVTDVGHDYTGNTLTARFDTNSTSSGPSLMTWLKQLDTGLSRYKKGGKIV